MVQYNTIQYKLAVDGFVREEFAGKLLLSCGRGAMSDVYVYISLSLSPKTYANQVNDNQPISTKPVYLPSHQTNMPKLSTM